MNSINITLSTPELIAALNALTAALSGKSPPVLELVRPEAVAVAQATPVAPVAPEVSPLVATQDTLAPHNPVSVAVIPAPVSPVPIATAPTYTLDMLARAGATLAQAGKMDQALDLLARYNIKTVSQLKPEQFGAFATELRALGAPL